MLSVSVVVPIYNEYENIGLLYDQLSQTLPGLGREYEILFVDDGSRDGSVEVLQALAAADRRVKVVRFRRNYGQTAGLRHGPCRLLWIGRNWSTNRRRSLNWRRCDAASIASVLTAILCEATRRPSA